MDLFEQRDKRGLSSGEREVIVRYRSRFHRDVIFSRLSTNPGKSTDEIVRAVSINDPARFLPQPWPPNPLDDTRSLFVASLRKMQAIVNVPLYLPLEGSVILTGLIAERFPKRLSIPEDATDLISCEVCIDNSGAVGYWCDLSRTSGLDASLLPIDGKDLYVKAMLILGMQLYAESWVDRVEEGFSAWASE